MQRGGTPPPGGHPATVQLRGQEASALPSEAGHSTVNCLLDHLVNAVYWPILGAFSEGRECGYTLRRVPPVTASNAHPTPATRTPSLSALSRSLLKVCTIISDFVLDNVRPRAYLPLMNTNGWESKAMTEQHTCTCQTCKGVAFIAPQGYIPQGGDYAAMVHNYAQMVRNPAMRGVMAARGLSLVEVR